jgi:hypothetical protein
MFFAIVFCIFAVSLTFIVLSVGKPFTGVELNYNNREWEVIYVDADGLANQVGIKEGDRPFEINHTPAQIFLEKTKTDMERWSRLLADQKLTQQDFGDLVAARKAVAEMHALTVSGIALTKAERFRSGLIDSVIDRAFAILL